LTFDALLDTNVISDLVRQPQGRVAEHIREIGEAQVCTSVIVAAELRYGAAKKESPRLTRQLEAVLGALDVLPFETPADVTYGASAACSSRRPNRSAVTISSLLLKLSRSDIQS
jgi:tRNA(fMet)-specific endonuclease VapC